VRSITGQNKPEHNAEEEGQNPEPIPEPVTSPEAEVQESPSPSTNSLRRKFSPQNQPFVSLDLKKAVESLLFASGKAMSEKDLCELTGGTPKKMKDALAELKNDYDSRDTSLTFIQNNDVWKLNVREKYVTLVTKIVADTELPFPVLETLSVIAFKAPVMQAEVIKIRGTNAYEHISTLIEGGFVEKRKKGRSFDLGLTTKCYDYFDVQGDRSLKEALKEARKPEKKVPEKLGDLPVVDVPEPPKDENKLGNLQVVEMEPSQPKLTIDNNKPDDDFLSKIDDQIGQLSKRNDEHDDDELFKKPAIEGENPEGQPAEEHGKTAEIFGDHSDKPTAENAYPDTDAEEEKKDVEEEQEDPEEEKEPAEEEEEEEDEDESSEEEEE